MKRAPQELSKKAKKFWNTICQNYAPSPEHFLVIEEICRLIDRLDQIREEIKTSGILIKNSTGTQKLNPLLRAENEAGNRMLASWKSLNFHVESIPAIIKNYKVGNFG